MTDAVESREPDSYGGLPGAFRYSFRRSDSRTFKLYAVLGAALSLLVAIIFALALTVLIADTLDSEGSLSLMRSFFVFVGLLVVLPIIAPVLLVARRHRRDVGDDARYDRRLALAGFAFLASLYVGLIPTVPPELQTVPSGPATWALAVPSFLPVDAAGSVLFEVTVVPAVVVDGAVAPVVEWFYGLPPAAGGVLVLLGVVSIVLVHRITN